ncbi:hypothetical protein CO059_02105, partial [candidate division WWE3 bacterium CG_4_9_14_0_2_um_filter_48_10]
MIQKLKKILFSFSAVIMFAIPLAAGGAASAAVTQTDFNNNLCSGSNGDLSGAATTGCDTAAEQAGSKLFTTVINVISIVVGIIAVIMIIVGGFRYITSGGKQESVAGAKTTILYALIGLVIVALAQI